MPFADIVYALTDKAPTQVQVAFAALLDLVKCHRLPLVAVVARAPSLGVLRLLCGFHDNVLVQIIRALFLAVVSCRTDWESVWELHVGVAALRRPAISLQHW